MGHPLCVVEGYTVSACGELGGGGALVGHLWGRKWGWGSLMGCGIVGHPLCVVEGYTVSACGELGGWGGVMGLGGPSWAWGEL